MVALLFHFNHVYPYRQWWRSILGSSQRSGLSKTVEFLDKNSNTSAIIMALASFSAAEQNRTILASAQRHSPPSPSSTTIAYNFEAQYSYTWTYDSLSDYDTTPSSSLLSRRRLQRLRNGQPVLSPPIPPLLHLRIRLLRRALPSLGRPRRPPRLQRLWALQDLVQDWWRWQHDKWWKWIWLCQGWWNWAGIENDVGEGRGTWVGWGVGVQSGNKSSVGIIVGSADEGGEGGGDGCGVKIWGDLYG